MACIYALEFTNGKMYIGQTRLAFNDRYRSHKKDASCSKAKVYKAWRKYGAPTICTLIICSIDMLNYYEEACIKLYNTFKNGYNSTTGGDSPLDTVLRCTDPVIIAQRIENEKALNRKLSNAWYKSKAKDPVYAAERNEISKVKYLQNKQDPEWVAKFNARQNELRKLRRQNDTEYTKLSNLKRKLWRNARAGKVG